MRNSLGKSAAMAARGGVFSALIVLVLLLAYPFEVLDLTLAAIAAILIWIIRLEYGNTMAVSVFITSSVLSILLMPGNTGSVFYALIMGWYPLMKVFLEKKIKNKGLSLLVKLATVTLAFGISIFLFFNLFVGDMDFSTLTAEIPDLLEQEHVALFGAFLNQKLLFGLNAIQWMMITLYLLFAPIFALLFDLLLNRFIPFYALRLRPMLIKAGIIKKGYK